MKGKKLLLFPALMMCAGNLSSCSLLCTVYWYDWDMDLNNREEHILEKDENVFAFEFLSYDGKTPTREPDAKYTYEFDYWEPINAAEAFPDRVLKRDTIYRAHYKETLRWYDIYFKDPNYDTFNGSILNHQYLEYSESEIPKFNYEYSSPKYEFKGWDSTIGPVTGEATYTAQYELIPYYITFKNPNYDEFHNDILDIQKHYYGDDAPSFDPHYSSPKYEFVGWDKEPQQVTGNATYVAQYELIPYHVIFEDGHGNILSDEIYHYGDIPSYNYSYYSPEFYFAGWDKDIVPVTEDVTYVAQYDYRLYDVYFKDGDGNVLYHQQHHWHDEIDFDYYSETSTKVFAGWDKPVTWVTGNVTYTAQYKDREYTVKWVNYDGELLEKDTLHYQEVPSFDSEETPTKPSNSDSYCWIFAGWDKPISEVTENVTYTAVYDKYEYRTFDLTYKYEDADYTGPEVITQVYEHNNVQLPQIIGEEYHDVTWYLTPELDKPVPFEGGEPTAIDVLDDMTFYGTDDGPHVFNIEYNLNGGTVDGDNPEEIIYVDTSDLIEAEKEGYTFLGWVDEDNNVYENLEHVNHDLYLSASFIANNYTISFNCEGCVSEIEPIEVTFDSEFDALPEAEKVGYEFNYWHLATNEDEFTSPYIIADNVTLDPKFTPIEYEIEYLNCGEEDGVVIDNENKLTYNIENRDEFELPTPEKEGYSFDGWEVISPEIGDGLVHSLNEINELVEGELLENISIKPSWTPLTISVDFDFDGGTKEFYVNFVDDDGETLLAQYPAAYEVSEVEYYVPEDKPGYQFAGWDKWPSDPNPIESDVTFVAKWNEIGLTPAEELNESMRVGDEKSFDLHNLNGCYIQFTPLIDQKVRISTNGDLDLYINSEQPDDYGVSLDEKNYWMEKEVKAGESYVFRVAGAENTDGDTTVKIERVDGLNLKPTETITAVESNHVDTFVSTYDSPITVPDFVPVKDGCKFGGWFTEKNGQGTKYQTGDIIKVPHNFILYAYWIEE